MQKYRKKPYTTRYSAENQHHTADDLHYKIHKTRTHSTNRAPFHEPRIAPTDRAMPPPSGEGRKTTAPRFRCAGPSERD